MLQSPNLVMIALGAEGLLPEVEDANHLRWQFDPELRFPRQGFDLYRRPHQAGSAVTLSPQVKSDLTARLGALYRELEVTVVHDGTGAKVVGRLWGEPMVEAGPSSWG